MIELEKYNDEIERFIRESIKRFENEIREPSSIGIYCCPWSGWISMNFNVTKTLEETGMNCPDFEFVEFDLIDFAIWQDEYESDQPQWKYQQKIYRDDFDQGDEGVNKFFFYYLETLLETMNFKSYRVLLQMLDSSLVKEIK